MNMLSCFIFNVHGQEKLQCLFHFNSPTPWKEVKGLIWGLTLKCIMLSWMSTHQTFKADMASKYMLHSLSNFGNGNRDCAGVHTGNVELCSGEVCQISSHYLNVQGRYPVTSKQNAGVKSRRIRPKGLVSLSHWILASTDLTAGEIDTLPLGTWLLPWYVRVQNILLASSKQSIHVHNK